MNTNPIAKIILCYGDSNTWGAIPYTHQRFPINIRWVGILQDSLGTDYEIISEGLPGRTFSAHNPEIPRHTGIAHLDAILRSHCPLDLIIIMLGTNDVKSIYGLTAQDIADNLKETIEFIREKLKGRDPVLPQILVVCPPAVVMPTNNHMDESELMLPGVKIFKDLPGLMKEVAEKEHCDFLDAGDFISLKNTDGYHLDEEDHKKLAIKIEEKIKSIMLSIH